MDIYWLENKKKCGPATVPDVISRMELGELTPDTPGWHAGCSGWMPLKELPAMADFLRHDAEETAEDEEDAPAAGDDTPTDAARPHTEPADAAEPPPLPILMPPPLLRFMARLVDIGLYAALVYTMIYVRELPFTTALLPSNPMVWLPYIVLEAAMVNFFGATPGKLLLGIRISRIGEPQETPGFLQSLNRAVQVYIGGMGMMFSFMPFIMCGFSLWVIRKRGISFWDTRCATLPALVRIPNPLRLIGAVLLLILCLQIVSLCLQPWMEPMLQQLSEQSPEFGHWLRQNMPPQG